MKNYRELQKIRGSYNKLQNIRLIVENYSKLQRIIENAYENTADCKEII